VTTDISNAEKSFEASFEAMGVEVGLRLRAVRLQKDVSQQELAEALDCSPSTIYNLETGKHLNIKTLFAACTVLEIELAKLFEPGSDSNVEPADPSRLLET
jgi:transcriptional regulator with XRE-family HTH domain